MVPNYVFPVGREVALGCPGFEFVLVAPVIPALGVGGGGGETDTGISLGFADQLV